MKDKVNSSTHWMKNTEMLWNGKLLKFLHYYYRTNDFLKLKHFTLNPGLKDDNCSKQILKEVIYGVDIF